MYQLSKGDRDGLLAMAAGHDNDARSEAVEKRLQAELPVIPGLADARSDAERQAVYAALIADERARFIARYGSAFACDEMHTTVRAANAVAQTKVCNSAKAA